MIIMDMIYLTKYFFFVGYIRVESPMSHTAQYCVLTIIFSAKKILKSFFRVLKFVHNQNSALHNLCLSKGPSLNKYFLNYEVVPKCKKQKKKYPVIFKFRFFFKRGKIFIKFWTLFLKYLCQVFHRALFFKRVHLYLILDTALFWFLMKKKSC